MVKVWHAAMGLKPRLTPAYVAVALMASVASAQPIAGPAVEVFANSLGRPHEGTVVILAEMLVGTDGIYSWELQQPLDILSRSDGLTVVGTIDTLSVSFESFENNPAVELSFGVTAGDNNTSFSITTGDLLFPGIRFPEAFATAQISVTDNNGNGANLDTFTGFYNTIFNREVGSMFWASLLTDDLTALPGGQVTAVERRPALDAVRGLIGSKIFSIRYSYSFNLSPNDSASGMGRFDVVPEPITISFLSVGGIALWRLRRRRS